MYETFIIVSAKGRKELTNMTKKDLIIHLEVELEMKKKDLERAKERKEKYMEKRDDFGTGYEYGLIFELENEIDSLERLLKEVKLLRVLVLDGITQMRIRSAETGNTFYDDRIMDSLELLKKLNELEGNK